MNTFLLVPWQVSCSCLRLPVAVEKFMEACLWKHHLCGPEAQDPVWGLGHCWFVGPALGRRAGQKAGGGLGETGPIRSSALCDDHM